MDGFRDTRSVTPDEQGSDGAVRSAPDGCRLPPSSFQDDLVVTADTDGAFQGDLLGVEDDPSVNIGHRSDGVAELALRTHDDFPFALVPWQSSVSIPI